MAAEPLWFPAGATSRGAAATGTSAEKDSGQGMPAPPSSERGDTLMSADGWLIAQGRQTYNGAVPRAPQCRGHQ